MSVRTFVRVWPVLSMAGVCALAIPRALASPAPPSGAPGIPFRWAPALKQAIGSAYEREGARSPLWFTLAEGAVSEVFFPSPDTAQSADLRFVVTDGKRFLSDPRHDTLSRVSFGGTGGGASEGHEGMAVQVTGTDRRGRYEYVEEIVADTAAPVLRVRIRFKWLRPGLRVFIVWRPALNNGASPMMATALPEALLVATQNGAKESHPVSAALLVRGPSSRFSPASAGYVGFSDGEQQLARSFEMTESWREAGPGNIALTGEVSLPKRSSADTIELALGFGRQPEQALTYARTSLEVPFPAVRDAYEAGWSSYLREIQGPGGPRFVAESPFARRSVQIIKMLEDKGRRGAIVASLSHPGIPGADRSVEVGGGGYPIVRPRDLYHSAVALSAAGDTHTPVDALKFLALTQRPDGSWPSKLWVNGKEEDIPSELPELDTVALPILLVEALQRNQGFRPGAEILEMVRRAASYILSNGPSTPRDRWGELGGYSPAVLAAEIAGLRAAGRLLEDSEAAQAADRWQTHIEAWTLVPGKSGAQPYYLRSSPAGTPTAAEPVLLAYGAGPALASELVDPSVLELVRLGVRRADDPRIPDTLKLIDGGLSGFDSSLPAAPSFRRYPRDAYGLSHRGGFWPLLAGERGQFAIAAGNLELARRELFILERSALQSGLLPEQLIAPPAPGRVTVGLGVASPLAWAHAEDIVLHRSLEEGRVFDSPRPLAGVPQASP